MKLTKILTFYEIWVYYKIYINLNAMMERSKQISTLREGCPLAVRHSGIGTD